MIDRTEEEIMKDWVGDINTPMVSVRCITYNHEPYIAQALDGFFMQKTTFPFEVIVHDDASTDKTAAIIREYEKKYPNILKAIYQTENQYSKRDGSIARIMNAACKGKYIAFCEGDDYWIDENKLQIQVDFLEANPDYSAYYSNVEEISASGDLIKNENRIFPVYMEHSIMLSDSHYYSLLGQIASCMIRNNSHLCDYMNYIPSVNGDVVISAIVRALGNIFYSEKSLAKHRISYVGDSWTARTHKLDLSEFYYISHLKILNYSRTILGKKYFDGNYILSKMIFVKIRNVILYHKQQDVDSAKKMLSLCKFKVMLPFYLIMAFIEKLLRLRINKRPLFIFS